MLDTMPITIPDAMAGAMLGRRGPESVARREFRATPCRLGSGLFAMAWLPMNWGQVCVVVSAPLGKRHDVVDLIGAVVTADVANAFVALENPPRAFLLGPPTDRPLAPLAALPRLAGMVRASGLGREASALHTGSQGVQSAGHRWRSQKWRSSWQ